METTIDSVLREAVSFEARAFDSNQEISGSDLVEWFAEWRHRARRAIRASGHSATAAVSTSRFHAQLRGALNTLQDLQAAKRRKRRGTASDIERWLEALDNGGLQLSVGPFRVLVFKPSTKGEP
jgi:hypothetical protein